MSVPLLYLSTSSLPLSGFFSTAVGIFFPPFKTTSFPRQMQPSVRDFNSINQMIAQSQFNERSKNQIKSNKEIPSSPAASSLLPLPTQPAALESMKESRAEQSRAALAYTAEHKVKHMKYATQFGFVLLFSLARWKVHRHPQKQIFKMICSHLLKSALTRFFQQVHSNTLTTISNKNIAGFAWWVRRLISQKAPIPLWASSKANKFYTAINFSFK